ncbi:MAG: MBL fold metallo-hydrolase [Phycisphaerales bacterium]|nr:MBL fold metallo-hydrolase [Phycisphaerales bacterium]
MVACDCEVCTSPDPRDKRTRPSIAVDYGDCVLLVDTTPEFRLQCLACGVRRVDAVLYTHHHADHVCGLDDLRRFNWIMKKALPCYANAKTGDALVRMFPYAFRDNPDYPSHTPRLEMQTIEHQPFDACGRRVVPIPLFHGPLPVLGFRFGSVAYCTDCSLIPDESYPLLENLDVLILDALRRTPHPTHFTLDQAVEHATRIGARQTLFTHIAHELKHAETNAVLPPTMALAFDGQIVTAAA